MIILLGPDGSGKTTLQTKLITEHGLQFFHAIRETDYNEYMEFLSGERSRPIPLQEIPFIAGDALQKDTHYICDRFFWCDGPYSEIIRNGLGSFSLKQLHNLHLATIAHNPMVILMNRKTPEYKDDYMAGELFTPILERYRTWLTSLGVQYMEWDYLNPPMTLNALVQSSIERQRSITWWRNLAKKGIAGYGNTANPEVFLIAEILGPSNVYHFPFEQGPSGIYLSELFDEGEVPLSCFYVTNWKKTISEEENAQYLIKELTSAGPHDIILLGNESRKSLPTIQALGYQSDHIHQLKHPGWVVNHAENLRDVTFRKQGYLNDWKETWRNALTTKDHLPADDELVITKVD